MIPNEILMPWKMVIVTLESIAVNLDEIIIKLLS